MAGQKTDDLEERIGYYGEQLVLLAQILGLNTCWVGLSYSKVPGTYVLEEGEKIACYIAIGYGETQGVGHKVKTVEQVSRSALPLGSSKNVSDTTPAWFKKGVEAALLAPTAVNQQKFSFEYVGIKDGRHQVCAKKGFSMIGYTKIDLGIAKYHSRSAQERLRVGATAVMGEHSSGMKISLNGFRNMDGWTKFA